ncbi:hypothetical protein JCM31267_31310 [Blautia wexlerae]
MRVTDMTGTMTKRIAGGIINASIIMKNMPCHNRKHSRYGKNKKELLVILSLKDDKGEQRYCQVAPRCLYLDDYKNLTDGIDGNKRLAFVLCFLSFFVSEML